ncbi:MAG TPA: hypothetical protein VFE70_06640, partial [Candidatus Elarobacter sp.]|nr:hypothetical protein [Candidatus Elarobacter sp.]
MTMQFPCPRPFTMLSEADLCFLSAAELAGKIRRRELSATEVVLAHLERIEKVNPSLNAVVTLDAEGALAAARRADEAQARRERLG